MWTLFLRVDAVIAPVVVPKAVLGSGKVRFPRFGWPGRERWVRGDDCRSTLSQIARVADMAAKVAMEMKRVRSGRRFVLAFCPRAPPRR